MNDCVRQEIEKILRGCETDGRTRLLEAEVYQILRLIGIETPRFVVLPIQAGERERRGILTSWLGELALQGTVVKIQSPDIIHKSEAGGIAICSGEPGEVLEASAALVNEVRARAPDARLASLLVCEKIPYAPHIPGNEVLLSLRQDPFMGPIVVLGIGGMLTEWFGQLAPGQTTRILSARDPIFRSSSPSEALDGPAGLSILFRRSRVHPETPLDPTRFWQTLQNWADLAAAFGNDAATSPFVLEEVEINPLAIVPGRSPVAVDGIGRFGTRRPHVRRRRVEKIHNLLEPRSVAVIGASGKAMNAGRMILQNLRAAGGLANGHIYAVHPKEERIDAIPCVRAIRDLPERVDMAVLSVPAEAARDAIRDLVELQKAHSIILIPGGFAERGENALANEIIEIMEKGRAQPDGGPVLVGGNCLGIVSKGQYNTFFLPRYKLPFHEARGDNLVMVSQSGAYLVTLASNLDSVVYPRASISFGNQMDLTIADFMEHYLDDTSVQVIACYFEGFLPLDGLRFVELVREHSRRGRTVIVYKAGRTALGAEAASSHTASLAGDYAVVRALLGDAGAIVVETLDEFEDFTKLFTMLYDRVPTGRRVGVISNAGFECTSAMDSLCRLERAVFSEATKRRLAACLPNIAHADNPVDATPMATTDRFIQAVEAVVEDAAVDALIVSAVPVTPALNDLAPDPAGIHPENIHSADSLPQELIRVFRSSAKPIVAAIDSGHLYDDCVLLLQCAGIPTYRKIDRATRALSRYCAARSQPTAPQTHRIG